MDAGRAADCYAWWLHKPADQGSCICWLLACKGRIACADTACVCAGPLIRGLGFADPPACEGTAFYALQSCINPSCIPSMLASMQNDLRENCPADRSCVCAGPLIQAMGYADPPACEGTAFYALQSCINHSCNPSTHAMKRDDTDEDGAAVILAKRGIAVGEEITISYIDESADLADRTKQLADYGFTCQCSWCRQER